MKKYLIVITVVLVIGALGFGYYYSSKTGFNLNPGKTEATFTLSPSKNNTSQNAPQMTSVTFQTSSDYPDYSLIIKDSSGLENYLKQMGILDSYQTRGVGVFGMSLTYHPRIIRIILSNTPQPFLKFKTLVDGQDVELRSYGGDFNESLNAALLKVYINKSLLKSDTQKGIDSQKIVNSDILRGLYYMSKDENADSTNALSKIDTDVSSKNASFFDVVSK